MAKLCQGKVLWLCDFHDPVVNNSSKQTAQSVPAFWLLVKCKTLPLTAFVISSKFIAALKKQYIDTPVAIATFTLTISARNISYYIRSNV